MTSDPATASAGTWHGAILVAEDDPASGQFFKAALNARGREVAIARDGCAALALARARRFDLLLLDCHMPGLGAPDILAALRNDPAAASHAAPAIATSAELDDRQRQDLQRSGFAASLSKPVALQTLHAAVRAALPQEPGHLAPLLDDQAALQSSGSSANLSALRGLFASELRRFADELDPLAAQPARLAERLHRLLASCGLCGAGALADACRRLKQHVDGGDPLPSMELECFRRTLVSTLQLLEEARRTRGT